MSYQSTVLADNPIRYYRLGESSGTVVNDLGSQAQNGTRVGSGITLAQTGLVSSDTDTSYAWNGTADSYLTCPNASITTGSFTLEAWVYLAGAGTVGSGTYAEIFGIGSGGTARLLFATAAGTLLTQQGGNYVSTTVLSLNARHHIVLVWDGTHESYWIDGIQDSTFTPSGAPTWSGAFQIGSDIGNYCWNGRIDEVAIYNTALTQAKISKHYNVGSGRTSAGGQVFPLNNIWNRRIDNLPIHASSATWISNSGTALQANFNALGGIPVNTSTSTDALVSVTFTTFPAESDPGPYRIPLNAAIEAAGDAHCLCYDTSNNILYELYGASAGGSSWTASNGAKWDLSSNALRTEGWTSADAAGLPVAPGLVQYDEIYTAGVINHAIRIVLPGTVGHIWPSTHTAGPQPANSPPLGARLRLKASYNISGFSAGEQVLYRCLQQYGAFVADNSAGTTAVVQGATDGRWVGTPFNGGLSGMPALSNFEYVDESAVMLSSTSAAVIALLQSATGSVGGSNANSVTVTTAATGSGNLLVAFVMVQGSAVTITPPANWTQVGATQGISGGTGSVAMFERQNSASGVTSHIFSFSASCNAAVAFEEWSGVATSNALDQQVAKQNAKSATSATGTTAALAGSGELAIWGLGVPATGVLTYSGITNSYVEDTSANATSSETTRAQATLFYNASVGSAATSSGATMSGTGGAGNTTILGVFRAAGAGTSLSGTLAGVGQLSATLTTPGAHLSGECDGVGTLTASLSLPMKPPGTYTIVIGGLIL